jgi:phosphatidylserine/phosphatidylglycerophosphate/cardiolipin synthase-like enzyme
MDAYFTQAIISSLPHQDINVRFLVKDVDGVIDAKTLSALNLAKMNLKNFQARSLDKLHSKVIIIDDKTFYLGSANWYWYSLNENWETTLTGNTELIPELILQLEDYWDIATPIGEDLIKEHRDFDPVKEDI